MLFDLSVWWSTHYSSSRRDVMRKCLWNLENKSVWNNSKCWWWWRGVQQSASSDTFSIPNLRHSGLITTNIVFEIPKLCPFLERYFFWLLRQECCSGIFSKKSDLACLKQCDGLGWVVWYGRDRLLAYPPLYPNLHLHHTNNILIQTSPRFQIFHTCLLLSYTNNFHSVKLRKTLYFFQQF